MRRIYRVNDERTQMAKIRYLQMKDNTGHSEVDL